MIAVSNNFTSIAVATDNGKITVLDIHKQIVLFTHNIARKNLIYLLL